MNNGVLVVSLYYDPYDGFIYHEDGRTCDDISHLISDKELAFIREVGGTQYLESDEDGIVYELVCPIPEEEILTLHYDSTRNMILDDDGQIMFNKYYYFTPQTMMLFREWKKDMLVDGKNGQKIRLRYY